VEPHGPEERPHVPSPSLWPIGFAVGVACILAGLIVSTAAVAVGVAITLVFGFLWVRDVTRDYRGPVVEEAEEPEPVEAAPTAEPIPAHLGPPAMPETDEEELARRFPRSKFLEGATLGIGGLIGGIVTVPALGFMVLPAFTEEAQHEIDLGPLDGYPEGQFIVATFLSDPSAGEVSRRTAYVRNNGLLNGRPSFTIVSNRCVHLGCPVQPNGLLGKPKTIRTKSGELQLTSVRPTGFGCPCHGGQYDQEGSRTAGPPVRALDRYDFAIRNGRLFLGKTYSVAEVSGTGANARIKRYGLSGPGEHVDGLESWLYPIPANDF
jgi:menaquinol-cytochrome c reductase iron-sulfur subunit